MGPASAGGVVGDVHAPVMHVEAAVSGRGLVMPSEDEQLAVVGQSGGVSGVIVGVQVIAGVATPSSWPIGLRRAAGLALLSICATSTVGLTYGNAS